MRPAAQGEARARQSERLADWRRSGQDWGSGGFGFGTGPGGLAGDGPEAAISPGPGGGHGEQWEGQDHGQERSEWWYHGGSFSARPRERRLFAGRGPREYRRADSRIREDVCDRLTDHPGIDAREIEVRVENGEVILTGSVRTREDKREVERLCERISGVQDVHNQLRVTRSEGGRGSGFDTREQGGMGDLATGPQGTTAGSNAP
jgi:hypothetical protein